MNGSDPMNRIDAHHHIWDLSVRSQDWLTDEMAALRRNFSIDDLRAAAEPHGITSSVLVHTVQEVAETEELLAIAHSTPFVAGVVGWIDITAPDVIGAIDRLRESPGGSVLRGIRHVVQSEPDVDWLRRPAVIRGLQALGDAGVAYDLLTFPPQLPAAIEAVRSAPQTTFVLDHLSKPYAARAVMEPWASDLRALAALPNVYCKLSGLATEADWNSWTVASLRPYVEVVMTAFGDERVMYGSDWPVCLTAASYSRWVSAVEELTAQLSPPATESFWHGAAMRAYRLEAR